MELKQLLNNRRELGREELVGLVHDEHGAFAQVRDVLSSQIQYSTGRSHNNMYRVLKSDDIVPESGTASCDHHIDAEVLANSFADLGRLHRQFSSGYQDQALDLGHLGVDLL